MGKGNGKITITALFRFYNSNATSSKIKTSRICYFFLILLISGLKIGYFLDLGFAEAFDPEVETSVMNGIQKFEEFGWSIEKSRNFE